MGKHNEKGQKQVKKRTFLRYTALSMVFIMIFGLSFGGYNTYAYINDAPKLNEKELNLAQSSTIYDREGNKIKDLIGKEHRKTVAFEDIPDHVVNAFIAVEDVRFWDHKGVDVKRIGGAILANIKEGFGAEGASTITQQVVKNMLLEPEKTMKRKVQEAYLAVELEEAYSKEEIFEMYVNKIYFGNGAYGVATAADTYFNKSLDELTTSEAALLAGLPQRPSGYDPYKHEDLAEERRGTVLYLMKKHGYINEKERKEAESQKVSDLIVEKKTPTTTNDAFIDQVIEDLKKAGIPETALFTGGLEIYTTLDQNAQKVVDDALTTDQAVNYPDEKFKAGIALIDTQTGKIKAIGGNRQSEKKDVQKGFNYATQLKRQPGSTIKPILDYGPGIENHKWSTNKQFVDEKLELNDKEISNWNDEFQGSVSIRTALQWSYNIPAIKAFMEVGGEEAKVFAENLGIPIDHTYPSYAIGGFKNGISPLQLAGAYASFGSGGVYHEPYSVEKVVYPNGKELDLAPEGKRAMSEGTAYMITDMLRTVVNEGTGMQAAIPGLDVAGKTGTTNLPENINAEGTSDSWFSGYTTNYTAAVWTGYDKTTADTFIHKKDDDIAKLLFKHVMTTVSKDVETASFKKPDSIMELEIDKESGLRANSKTPSSQIIKELYFVGEEPEKAKLPKPKPEKKDNDEDKKKDQEKDEKSSNENKENEQSNEGNNDSEEQTDTESQEQDETSEDSNEENAEEGAEGSGDDDTGSEEGTGGSGSGDDGSGEGTGGSGSGDDGSEEGTGGSGSGDDGSEEGTGGSGSGDDGSEEGTGDSGSGDSGSEGGTGGSGSGDSGSEEGTGGSGSGDDGSEEGTGGSGSGDSGSEEGTGGSGSGDSGSEEGTGGSGSGESGSEEGTSGSGSGESGSEEDTGASGSSNSGSEESTEAAEESSKTNEEGDDEASSDASKTSSSNVNDKEQ
ncbi:transglycosylase domain-containing protein [Guptibacillus algicola]|uniref:transglycosylase domain-containing protein n=1 Tax=Guptibacillus algicola TaxID=225844 RepID=UPI001CD33929|nr:PBP1A family penicillin-binding protein [Alkalihalobacillus algicola]MCA0987705.1 PBP1A family penicillin-binding protein [Alkalihalobacillus algicola]